MVFDQRLEVVGSTSQKDTIYKASNWMIDEPSAYEQTVCSFCNVKREHPEGDI